MPRVRARPRHRVPDPAPQLQSNMRAQLIQEYYQVRAMRSARHHQLLQLQPTPGHLAAMGCPPRIRARVCLPPADCPRQVLQDVHHST